MTTTRHVVCVDNTGYEVSLERRKIYEVIPDREAAQLGELRVVDESGEDYLYPARLFEGIHLSATLLERFTNAA